MEVWRPALALLALLAIFSGADAKKTKKLSAAEREERRAKGELLMNAVNLGDREEVERLIEEEDAGKCINHDAGGGTGDGGGGGGGGGSAGGGDGGGGLGSGMKGDNGDGGGGNGDGDGAHGGADGGIIGSRSVDPPLPRLHNEGYTTWMQRHGLYTKAHSYRCCAHSCRRSRSDATVVHGRQKSCAHPEAQHTSERCAAVRGQ